MSFDSLTYLLFLPAVTLLHWLCPPRGRWAVLLAASLVFYMSWNVPLTLLLAAVILLAYGGGRLLARLENLHARRAAAALILCLCVGVLLYFKYFRFLAEAAALLARPFGGGVSWEPRDVLLPVGCSFYTFQAMSYVIDVSRDPRRAEPHLGYFALYIAFFPQLVAGPIERADRLLPQLRAERRWTAQDGRMGARLLLGGYFRKIVLADFCGRFADAAYGAAAPDGSAVFFGTLLFGLQIYCDFAGYSEIAQGSARLLGVRLMRNFDRPHLARSFQEFWRRWHISLGRWFADYVYIPLGGSRRGPARQLAATLLVFALSGLWHGADWTFLAWGLLHGVYRIGELLLARRRGAPAQPSRLRAWGQRALVLAGVSFAWIFFRAESLPRAWFLLRSLVSPWDLRAGLALLGMGPGDLVCLLLALGQSGLLHRLSRESCLEPAGGLTYVYLLLAVALGWLLRLDRGGAGAFIYFQF